MPRSMLRIVKRSCGFNKHVSEMVKFYNRLRNDEHLKNPEHDYAKCVNKINLNIYRLIIAEYEANYKPQVERKDVLLALNAILDLHQLNIRFAETGDHWSLVRETDDLVFELKIRSYIDDTNPPDSGKQGTEEPSDWQERVKQAKTIRYETENIDERYFFQMNGRFVPPAQLPFMRHMLKAQTGGSVTIQNPFCLVPENKDIIDFVIKVNRKGESNGLLIDGFICDL